MHGDPGELDLDTRFRMVKGARVFDYDKTPPVQEPRLSRRGSQKHGLPMTAGGFYYFLGRDDSKGG